MLFALSSSEGTAENLPPCSQTLPLGELFHKAVSFHGAGNFSPNLTGCDAKGQPLAQSHGHIHVIPLDLDGDYRLDHILAWLPAGWNADEEKSLSSVTRLYAREGQFSLSLHLVAAGDLNTLVCDLPLIANPLHCFLETAEGASEWISATPFVAPRHMKKRGRNSLEGQICSELTSRLMPEPLDIVILDAKREAPGAMKDFLFRQHDFIKKRTKIPPPADFGFSLYLRFPHPCSGPLCLGYGSHFGLGLFRSIEHNQ